MAHDTLMLITHLSGLRINVLANRLGCDNGLARNVHDKLARVLGDMIEAQRKILAAEHAVVRARGTADEQDAHYDLYHYRAAFIETWIEERIALLDEHLVDDFTREFYDFREKRWYFCEGVLPIVVPVVADKLSGLKEIISEIEDLSGVSLTLDNVYYSEAEAEAARREADTD